MSLSRTTLTSNLKWLLIFCILIQMVFWSQSQRHFEYLRLPVWFNIIFKGTDLYLSVNGYHGCITGEIIAEYRDAWRPFQYWRWYKGMLMNNKKPYVLDINEGRLENGTKTMLFYAEHSKNQCWTVINVTGGQMLANCYAKHLRLTYFPKTKFDHLVGVDTVGKLVEFKYPGVDGWPLVGYYADQKFPD